MRIVKAAASGLASISPVVAALMLSAGVVAGQWAWPRGWIFSITCAAFAVCAHIFMAVRAPESLTVRQRGPVASRSERQPFWDIAALCFFLTYLTAFFAFIPIDVFRLRIAPTPHPAVALLGGLIVLAGLSISHLAVIQNRFAAPTIHDQSTRGQEVIDTGLYAHIRHPLYAGNLLTFAGMCLWLQSYTALAWVLGVFVFSAVRIGMEEAYLRAKLPAYEDYVSRVRSRLIPGLY